MLLSSSIVTVVTAFSFQDGIADILERWHGEVRWRVIEEVIHVVDSKKGGRVGWKGKQARVTAYLEAAWDLAMLKFAPVTEPTQDQIVFSKLAHALASRWLYVTLTPLSAKHHPSTCLLTTTTSPPLDLDMDFDPLMLFTLTRVLAVQAGLDPAPLDGVIALGGYSYVTATNTDSTPVNHRNNIYTYEHSTTWFLALNALHRASTYPPSSTLPLSNCAPMSKCLRNLQLVFCHPYHSGIPDPSFRWIYDSSELHSTQHSNCY